jgi:hypothetical protein
MSRENVESVRDAIDAVNHSDWDGAFKGAAPGFELDLRALAGFRSPPWIRGLGGCPTAVLGDVRGTFRSRSKRVIHADEEHVVTRVRPSGSDAEISNRVFQVWTSVKIVRLSLHTDRNQPSKPPGCGESVP